MGFRKNATATVERCSAEVIVDDRLLKKSKYIPKRLRSRVEKMNAEKVPVKEILEVLGVKE